MRRQLSRVPAALALILLAGALEAVAWDIALPAFQGPDEISHFGYVQHLAETGSAVSVNVRKGNGAVSSEAGALDNVLGLQPLMGNLAARPAWSSADLSLWHRIEAGLPRGSRANGNGPNSTGQNPPLYYAAMAIPYRVFVWLPLLKRLFVLRLFNALCFLATIALTWIIAGDLFGRVRWKQTLAAGVVALQPELAFMSGVINSDNFLVVLTTGFFLACLRLVMRGPSLARVLAASGLSAAAILTHGRGLVTVPVLAIALLVTWVKHRPALRQAVIAAGSAAAAVGAAFFAYFLFGRASSGGSFYGGEVHAVNSGAFHVGKFLSSIFQFYFPRLHSLPPRIGPAYGYRQVFITSFYGTFGSLEVTFKQYIYDILQVFSGLGLVAFFTACVVRWRSLIRSWPVVTLMLGLVVTLLFFLHYVSYRELIIDGGRDPVIVGRYLLPIVSLFGLAITFTVGSLPRRAGPLAGAVILGIGLLLALGGIGITAARFYA